MKPQAPIDPYALETRRNTLALGIGIGVLVALLLIGGGLVALGLFGPKGQNVTSQAPLKTPIALPQAGQPVAPALPIEKPKDVAMPDDIYNWLEHLRITEEKKHQLALAQIADFSILKTQLGGPTAGVSVEGLSNPDSGEPDSPDKVAKNAMSDRRPEWQELQKFFLSVPPPSECAPIQASYSQHLGECSAMFGEVMDIFSGIAEDPQSALTKAYSMLGKSTGRVDEFGIQTDSQVKEICDKYHTRKWFEIKGDVGGGIGPVLGLPGF
ncbi:MAG: hypothetical protein KF824_00200 [Fimbriimonadaceae bacterium]|nr:MAG: hypothetical protein KF824_00200 [Fimbriimonadaceae bacterium]